MVVNFMCFGVLVFNIFVASVRATKRIVWCLGSTVLCIKCRPEDGTLLLKHVGVFNAGVLSSAWVCCCNDPAHVLIKGTNNKTKGI
jgi:hypothetical protein